jgi:hypothetical protein
MTIDTVSKTIRKQNARKRSNWQVGRSEQAIGTWGFSLLDENDKSFGLFLVKSVANC